MKKLLLLLVLCGLSTANYAQNKEIEAIAAYQMAEELFEKKEYRQAINSLDVAKGILGTANSKMLYLEVMACQGLSDRFTEYPDFLEELEEAIAAFEKTPDLDQFPQEKRVEVARIKMTIPNRMKVAKQGEKDRESKAALKLQAEKAITHLLNSFPKPEGSLESFVTHPYAEYLNRYYVIKKNSGERKGNSDIIYGMSDPFTNNKENERIIRYLTTDKNNNVKYYWVAVEITNTDAKQAITTLLGMPDFDTVFAFDEEKGWYYLNGSPVGVFIRPEIKTSDYTHKRNKKSTYIKYIELGFYK